MTLSADVRADALAAGAATDIRTARVTFVDRGTGARLCGPLTPVPAAGATSPAGTVHCQVRLRASAAATGTSYTIGTVVSGGYARDSSADDAVITVARPLASGITVGGGYVAESRSAGTDPADPGSDASFGLAVRNGGGAGPRGTAEIIVRSRGRTYQVTVPTVTSLTATAAAPGRPGSAAFDGTAGIEDITDPAAPVPVDRAAAVRVGMTDGGSPSRDTIALTAWTHQGVLWFSSNWNGTTIVQQVVGAGDLDVR